LEYSLNYLIIRGEEERRIHLSEIDTLIIQSTAVAMTGYLLSELVSRKINVLFCDEKSNPQAQLLPFYGCHNSYERIMEQIGWSQVNKDLVWKKIVQTKILNQGEVLIRRGHQEAATMLFEYAPSVQAGDPTNREGHAAKVYFNALFGSGFSRDTDSFVNRCLNYGYAVFLSAINRELASFGCLTQLGIHHRNPCNPFNLSCDLIEPLRPIVDDLVSLGKLTNDQFKKDLSNLLNLPVTIGGKNEYLKNAISIYVRSALSAIQGEKEQSLSFISDYEL
jgi:CRISPR-associated endonuclease Cas1 subtype II